MARIWGYWDCNYCDSKKIRADNTHCPTCGSPRSDDTIFYVDKSTREVVDKKDYNDKENWICPYCESQNNAKDENCENCGAARCESKLSYFEARKEVLRKRQEEREKTQANTQNTNLRKLNNNDNKTKPEKTKKPNKFLSFFNKYKKHIAIGLIICIGIGIASWLLTPFEHKGNIDSFSWSRVIEIEELKTYQESGWSLPADARLNHTTEEIKEYKKEIDYYETKTRQIEKQEIVGYEDYVSGHRDLGNGQFEEIISQRPVYKTYYETETYQEPVYKDVPIYATKYYYEIDRWTETRNIRTSENDKNPYWGEVILGYNERQGDKREYYYIKCGKYEKDISYSEWKNYNVNDPVIITTDRFGNIVYSIKPA